MHSKYHVHATDQLLIAIDGAEFIETAEGREEFGPVTATPGAIALTRIPSVA